MKIFGSLLGVIETSGSGLGNSFQSKFLNKGQPPIGGIVPQTSYLTNPCLLNSDVSLFLGFVDIETPTLFKRTPGVRISRL